MAKIFFTEEDSRSFLTLPVKKNLLKIIEKSLLDRFSKRSKLSKVFIDPKLKNYIVPLTQRSSSKSLDTVERGSQIEYDEKAKTIRMFVYWHENDKTGRIDVDLSAIGFDDKWKALAQLSWTNLASLGSTHSGDIQSAPNGASEFIDINLDKFEAAGIRYVAMSIYAFTHQHFSQFQCFAGIMPRQNPNSGEAYEPKTVKNILDITADGKIAMPLILDLKRKKIVWCDVALAKSGNRTETTSHKIANMGKSVIAMNHQSPNLFDLLSLHVKARSGEVVTEFHKQDIYDLVLEESFARNISEILRNWI
jgi:stress response protein SCP2